MLTAAMRRADGQGFLRSLRAQLPEAPLARAGVLAALALGALVALGLTALILLFAWTWWRS